MTETAPLSFQSTPDDPLERRVASIGRVLPHVEVKVVDAATGRTLPRGQRGELWTRGYNVMRGYWQDEAATAAAITPARWMRTGDLAVIDGEGYGHIVGRIKDLVIRGGENIAPREVEEWLMTHPAVLDAQVFGVADERLGEELCAWVRLRPGAAATAAELRAHCAGSIAHFKVPRYVQLVDAFPLTTSGKPQKFIMREEAERRLGLAKAGLGQQPAEGAAAG
jgi:fatty-acyl-CoA synthase